LGRSDGIGILGSADAHTERLMRVRTSRLTHWLARQSAKLAFGSIEGTAPPIGSKGASPADENSAFGQIFNGLDKLVDATVTFFSAIFTVKSFTK
jgi:hypothetical protein